MSSAATSQNTSGAPAPSLTAAASVTDSPTYDFTTRPARRGTGSSKWEGMLRANPEVPEGVVPLSTADMEFVTAPAVRQCLHRLADEAVLGYTGPTDAYFDAVLGWQRTRHGWDPKREWVATCPGVVPALYRAVKLFSEPGEGVIIQPPVYFPFKTAAASEGRTLVENPLVRAADGTYSIDFDDLERKAADPANKLLLLCSPHNPVGRVWSAAELRRVADICLANGVFIVCDEIHNDLILPGHEFTSLGTVLSEDELKQAAVCTAPSKTFNLAGVQCSNIFIADEARRQAFVRHAFKQGGPFGLNAFAYPLCTCAYNECAGWLDALLGVLDDNRRLVEDYLARNIPQIKAAPLEGTYLMWLDCSALGLSDEALDELMVKQALLFGDKGTMFGTGGEGYTRINIACPAGVLTETLDRLAAAVRGL